MVALRWIRDNFDNFGGNPSFVKITGNSTGSWGVILHMISPMSQGLLHRVIAMSGSPTTHFNIPRYHKHLLIKQAELLNCSTENLAEVVDCMRTRPFDDFVRIFLQFFLN